MDDLKLVKLVKQYDCIYDKNNKDFRSVSKKKAAWQRIAREIGIHEKGCIRRWTNLRERFNLTFLKQHIVHRINRQKWTLTAEGKVPQIEYNAETSMEEHEDPEVFECVTEPFQFKSSTSVLSEPETLQEGVTDFIPNYTRSSPPFEAEIQKPKTYQAHQNSKTKQNYEFNAAVHGFGQMIVETICGMSERKQAIAMQKVTELVMNIKLQPES